MRRQVGSCTRAWTTTSTRRPRRSCRSGWSWTAGRGDRAGLPLREEIQIPVSEQLIVELYSK